MPAAADLQEHVRQLRLRVPRWLCDGDAQRRRAVSRWGLQSLSKNVHVDVQQLHIVVLCEGVLECNVCVGGVLSAFLSQIDSSDDKET